MNTGRYRIRKRAEVALRALPPKYQARVYQGLTLLFEVDPDGPLPASLRKLQGFDPNLYVYRLGRSYRAIFSREGGIWVLEDIMLHDRLKRMLRSRSRS